MTKKFKYIEISGVETEALSFELTDFNATGGVGSENLPIIADAAGLIDPSFINITALGSDHHSAYQEIPLNEEITIGDKKQMNVLGGHFKVSGFLKIEGELRIRE